ncbi:MAG: FtsX-like permease family protein [Pseudomonadota bacterium]|nr:FtsX-like permease family protein [Pseudomonadota bacterium]
MTAMTQWWAGLAATTQDLIWLVLLLLPGAVVAACLLTGHRPAGLSFAILRRFRFTSLLFLSLIAVSVAIGTGLIAQERGLREATARAADPFDLVVAAPGSEITMLLAAVYLRPSDVPLLSGAAYDEIARDHRVAIAAPIGFGDSVDGAPVVGSTAEFVAHLSGNLAEGRFFEDHFEAIAGASVPLSIGDRFSPQPGLGEADDDDEDHAGGEDPDHDRDHQGEAGQGHALEAEGEPDHSHEHHHAHEGFNYTVVGRMVPTGSPWDKAVIVPIEAVWEIHGLPNGHAPEREEQVGPPFDPAYFPGTPAVLVKPRELYQAYALRADFQRDDMMAFFPGTVLSELYSVLGDVREAMSLMAVLTQFLVTAGVLAGLAILSRLFSRQMALLRAIGAPTRFAFSVIWLHAATLILGGAILGLGLGYLAARAISGLVAERTDIAVSASIGWSELHLVAAFISLTLIFALLAPLAALARPIVKDLRA